MFHHLVSDTSHNLETFAQENGDLMTDGMPRAKIPRLLLKKSAFLLLKKVGQDIMVVLFSIFDIL